ncbi:hypothetical protein ACJRO7_003707 [Eucalyptus globulus]|uniref:Uncharacterized protein n=1 Tax=Eucalyptus globulus TaxID=34317 RepID=A0ABD3IXG8_EUCGL
MAPKNRRIVKRRSTMRKPRKAHHNQKKAAQASSQETPSHAPLGLAPSAAGSDQKLTKTGGDHDPTIESAVNIDFSCSTPKGKRFRIPKIRTCPPAPMKKRVRDSNRSSSLQRSPISFFASPDIELFFFAHHGLSG